MRETRKTIGSQEIAVAMGLAMILGITGCADSQEGGDNTDATELTESGAEASEGQTDKASEGTEHLGGKI